jgi:hydrogenase maturation protease
MHTTLRVLGAGSLHGDDRAGWEVVRRLWQDALPGVEVVALGTPLDLLEHLEGAGRLVVVDACRSGAEPGTLLRLTWPGPGLVDSGGPSSHGFGVASVLRLARSLRRPLPTIVLLGVEGQSWGPGAGMSAPVKRALPELCERVRDEVGVWAGGPGEGG